MADVTETDYTTDPPTIIERAYTAEEIAQREADQAANAAAESERQQAEADALAAREAALAKLAALGLTVDDLTALGL